MKTKTSILLLAFSFSLLAFKSSAQIAINNTATNPDASAILDLQSGNSGVNKGFLPQAVALTASNSASPVTSPATGLIVYNTATAGSSPNNVVPGYYYWNGSAWLGLGAPSMGIGNTNYVAVWTPNGNTLGTGLIQDNGSGVGVNAAPVSNVTLYANATNGQGIYGNSSNAAGDSAIGNTFGVYGYSSNTNSGPFAGVYGRCDNRFGVWGYSANQTGVFGQGDNNTGVDGSSQNGVGVSGSGATFGGTFGASKGQGIYARSSNAAGDSATGITYGVYGYSSSGTSGNFAGVYGQADNQTGVQGYSHYNTGVSGQGGYYGGYFYSPGGEGVFGEGVFASSATAAGDSARGATYGVYGYSYSTAGTEGPSAGVFGENDHNGGCSGVYGKAPNGYGVWGNGITGIYGTGSIIGVDGYGVNYGGSFASTTGVGVYSNSNYTTGDSAIGKTYGVYGYTSDITGNYAGVYGTGSSYGVIGYSTNNSFAGVYGQDDNNNGVWGVSANQTGVYGTSTNGTGVNGTSTDGTGTSGTSTNGVGVYGQGDNYYGVEGSSVNGEGVYGYSSAGGNAVYGQSQTGIPVTGYFVSNSATPNEVFKGINNYTGTATYIDYYNGVPEYKIIGAGSVSTQVKDANGDRVVLHAPETPEIYFEDYGEGQLVNGKAHVTLDATIVKNVTINEKHPLRAYIQLEGDCNGVYVTNKTATGFDVVELKSGTSGTHFQWHIVCNRADEVMPSGNIAHYADIRLEKGPVEKDAKPATHVQ